MKRRLTIIAAVIAVVGGLTACIPIPALSNGGYTKARAPHRTSVTVANPSWVNGHDMIHSTSEWNYIAGWRLLDVYPVNDAYGIANADVRFQDWGGPIIDPRGGRHAAWVQQFLNGDGSVNHCVVWIDREMMAASPHNRHPDVMSHEIGHCLGWYTTGDVNPFCEPGYQGVMSYCNFTNTGGWWTIHAPPWWGADDVQMLANAGYR
jgi:hypothetical protein